MSTFAGVMKGGKDGVIVVPGDFTNSLLDQDPERQALPEPDPGELTLVKQWIDAGAPEK